MSIVSGGLALYKNRPARIASIGDKIELELEGGETVQVRPKDIFVLHPGPLRRLSELQPQQGEVQAAWEILAGNQTTLAELAELAYGSYTPATAWAAWQAVMEGLYFRGTPDMLIACTPQEVGQKQAARQAELAQRQAWADFLERVRVGQITPDDRPYLREVEDLALGRSAKSRILRELGRETTPENAHALLLRLGVWDHTVNPYPQRFGLDLSTSALDVPDLPDEPRLDLTHLPAFAIDDEGAETPDDAVSLEGQRVWVHVADAAALALPDSPLDIEARGRGASVYLPEVVAPMLPLMATQRLGLGLNEISPALSVGMEMTSGGEIATMEPVLSWVRVTRLTYEQVEARLTESPFADLWRLARVYKARRQAQGALALELPEVQVRVRDGQVVVRPVPPLQSRELVQEAMTMAGEAFARFGIERNIPLPFAAQEPPAEMPTQTGWAGMYALRRALKPSQRQVAPARHASAGLAAYVQATSPLRRYLDLVAHQQVRAYLREQPLLDSQAVLERIGAAEAALGNIRQVEGLSARHWTLVYLLQHPKWRGEGAVVDRRGASGKVLIPELGLEASVHLPADVPLNSNVPLALHGVNLPLLEPHFQVVR